MRFLGEICIQWVDFTPLTLAAFVFPVELIPLMIPITLRTYNCLYFPAWAEGLKDFPKTLLQKQILSLHFPLQEEGKGQRTSYQRGLVNIWFTKRNLLRVVEVGIFLVKDHIYEHGCGSRSEIIVRWFLFPFLCVDLIFFPVSLKLCGSM